MTPEEALNAAREITAEILDSDCVDDPEELLLPLAEAFRVLDETGVFQWAPVNDTPQPAA